MLARWTLAALAAVALAACGGEGGGERLTKGEYVEQADAICAEASARLAALPEPRSLEELADVAPRAAAIAAEQLERLRRLRPPADDEAKLDHALDLTERQNALVEEIGEAAAAGDGVRVSELLEELAGVRTEARSIAVEYGLEVCGHEE